MNNAGCSLNTGKYSGEEPREELPSAYITRAQMFFSHGRRGPNATKIHESSLSTQEWKEPNGSFCQSLFFQQLSKAQVTETQQLRAQGVTLQHLTELPTKRVGVCQMPVSLLWSSVQLQAVVKWTKACESHWDGNTAAAVSRQANWTRTTAVFVDHLVNEAQHTLRLQLFFNGKD